MELTQSETYSSEFDNVALTQIVSVCLIRVQYVLSVFYNDPSHLDVNFVRIYFDGLIVEQPVATLFINETYKILNLWLIRILRIFFPCLLSS